MKRKKLEILKILFTRILEINSESISKTFFQIGLVFFGALLGGIVSISLSKNLTSFKTWIILISIFFGIALFFNILKHRQRLGELLKKFSQSI